MTRAMLVLAASFLLAGCPRAVSDDPREGGATEYAEIPEIRPVTGTIGGQDVTIYTVGPNIGREPSRVLLTFDRTLRLADNNGLFPNVVVEIHLPIDVPLDAVGRRFSVRPEDTDAVTVRATWIEPGSDAEQTVEVSSGIALNLSFGDLERARILPGEISLVLPNATGGNLSGNFIAAVPRDWNLLPTPDETPAVHGDIVLADGLAEQTVVAGIIGFGAAADGARHPDDARHHHTHVSTMLGRTTGGDGQIESMLHREEGAALATFQHLFLVPGPYLVYASVNRAIVDWRWVDILPDSVRSIDLAMDAAQAGDLMVLPPAVPSDAESMRVARLLPLGPEVPSSLDDSALLGAGISAGTGSAPWHIEGLRAGEYLLSWGDSQDRIEVRPGERTTVQLGN